MDSPTATVTFLFTDIEGSTRLWQEHPDTMPEALARHDALAREVIGQQNGDLFKHTGDGVCAAFTDASAALEAALALQRGLRDASWAGPRLHVRIALDSGPAQRRQGDYFGPTLNRLSRVLAVGAGGQILATAATIALVPGAATTDLGLHRLRDLGEPVRLHQLVAPDLAQVFPPLKSLDAVRHCLPVVRSTFVGRDGELARLRGLLAAKRLLTITGVGGCGKTRLALALASQELDRFQDGAFFVDLSGVMEPALAWSAVAGALGAAGGMPSGGLWSRDVVLGRLRDATALVLLDNCEHLLDATADVATGLVDASRSVCVVATSREPLGVEGEQVFRVPSLALPANASDAGRSEAVRLFVERATAADAAFTLTPDVTASVVEICRRLDGIPLAIELAAARVRHLSVADIVRRLDDRFRLLTGGPRGGTPRQQTLAAALAWSFDLLAERERMLLQRCAVFVDGFSLDAAEGVCAGNGIERDDIVDVLGALVDKSLVSLDTSEYRYRLLETVRLYAMERLTEVGEAYIVRTRHMAWFEETYRAWRPRAVGEATRDIGNLRAARAWARAMSDDERVARLCVALYWQGGDYDPAWHEEHTWCRMALASDKLAPEVRAEILAVASYYDIAAGEWPEAIEHARCAIGLVADPGVGTVSMAYMPLAVGLMVRDPDAADRAIDEGLEHLHRAAVPEYPPAFLATLKVATALMRGDPARAVELGRQNDVVLEAGANRLAYALHLVGDHAAAEAEAARRRRQFWGGGSEYLYHLLVALTASATRRADDATRELAAAVAAVRRYRYPLTLNDCVVVCGALAALDGRLERACVLLAAVADRGSVRSPEIWAVYLHYRHLVRAGLDAATVRRCREEARTLDFEQALDGELARRGQ